MATRKKPELDHHNHHELTHHAYWITDYYTKSIESIRTGAATLIGLIGVEIGFLATWKFENISASSRGEISWLIKIAIVSLFIAICGFALCLAPRTVLHPNLQQIEWALEKMPAEELHSLPLRSLLHKNDDEGRNIFEYLAKWKGQVFIIFNVALVFCLLAQSALLFSIYQLWF